VCGISELSLAPSIPLRTIVFDPGLIHTVVRQTCQPAYMNAYSE
jgi:hypothetical protein